MDRPGSGLDKGGRFVARITTHTILEGHGCAIDLRRQAGGEDHGGANAGTEARGAGGPGGGDFFGGIHEDGFYFMEG